MSEVDIRLDSDEINRIRSVYTDPYIVTHDVNKVDSEVKLAITLQPDILEYIDNPSDDIINHYIKEHGYDDRVNQKSNNVTQTSTIRTQAIANNPRILLELKNVTQTEKLEAINNDRSMYDVLYENNLLDTNDIIAYVKARPQDFITINEPPQAVIDYMRVNHKNIYDLVYARVVQNSENA